MNKTAHPDEDGTPVTPPLPDRIAAAINDLTMAQAECTWAEAGTFTLRSEKDDRAKEARDARSKLVAAIAEVVAERDWLQHHFPEQIAKALGTTSEVTGRTPSMVASCVAKVVAERDAQRECFNLLAQRCDAAERKVDSLIDQRDAATKRADGLAAELAAAQAKLATAVGALKTAQRILAECGEDSMEVDDAIAAAEQGGA